jgi:hypothetical protein
MGAWGVLAYDNDTANDWAYGLEDVADLSLVEAALEAVSRFYVAADVACCALAACEVLARSLGRHGYRNSFTEKVDLWVARHRPQPSADLLTTANTAMDRILGPGSDLRDLWYETSNGATWRASVEDLRDRLRVGAA